VEGCTAAASTCSAAIRTCTASRSQQPSTLAQAAAVDAKQLQQLWRGMQQLWRQLQQQQWRQQRRQQEQQQPGRGNCWQGAYWLRTDMGPAGKGPAGTGHALRGVARGSKNPAKCIGQPCTGGLVAWVYIAAPGTLDHGSRQHAAQAGWHNGAGCRQQVAQRGPEESKFGVSV
jgi:hypothetical protein